MARRKRTPLARVASFALNRAMSGGRREWFYVALGAQGLRLLNRVLTPQPEVFRMTLRPGDAIEVRELPRER
jgi:hypothetical protein